MATDEWKRTRDVVAVLGRQSSDTTEIVKKVAAELFGDPRTLVAHNQSSLIRQFGSKIGELRKQLQATKQGREFLEHVAKTKSDLVDTFVHSFLSSMIQTDDHEAKKREATDYMEKKLMDLFDEFQEMKRFIKHISPGLGDASVKRTFITFPDEVTIPLVDAKGIEIMLDEVVESRGARVYFGIKSWGGWHGPVGSHSAKATRMITRILFIPSRTRVNVTTVTSNLTAKADGYTFSEWVNDPTYVADKISSLSAVPAEFDLNITRSDFDAIDNLSRDMTIYFETGNDALSNAYSFGRSIATLFGKAAALAGPEGQAIGTAIDRLEDYDEKSLTDRIEPANTGLIEEIKERKANTSHSAEDIVKKVLIDLTSHQPGAFNMKQPAITKTQSAYIISDVTTYTTKTRARTEMDLYSGNAPYYEMQVEGPGGIVFPPHTGQMNFQLFGPSLQKTNTFLGLGGASTEYRYKSTVKGGTVALGDCLLTDLLGSQPINTITAPMSGGYGVDTLDLSVFLNGILYATRPDAATDWTYRTSTSWVNEAASRVEKTKRRPDTNRHTKHRKVKTMREHSHFL